MIMPDDIASLRILGNVEMEHGRVIRERKACLIDVSTLLADPYFME